MTSREARFLESARERASEKGMSVEVYLTKQIKLSALALETVTSDSAEKRPDSVAMAFDVQEIADAAERLENVISADYEQI